MSMEPEVFDYWNNFSTDELEATIKDFRLKQDQNKQDYQRFILEIEEVLSSRKTQQLAR
jgi:hypothetical protein